MKDAAGNRRTVSHACCRGPHREDAALVAQLLPAGRRRAPAHVRADLAASAVGATTTLRLYDAIGRRWCAPSGRARPRPPAPAAGRGTAGWPTGRSRRRAGTSPRLTVTLDATATQELTRWLWVAAFADRRRRRRPCKPGRTLTVRFTSIEPLSHEARRHLHAARAGGRHGHRDAGARTARTRRCSRSGRVPPGRARIRVSAKDADGRTEQHDHRDPGGLVTAALVPGRRAGAATGAATRLHCGAHEQRADRAPGPGSSCPTYNEAENLPGISRGHPRGAPRRDAARRGRLARPTAPATLADGLAADDPRDPGPAPDRASRAWAGPTSTGSASRSTAAPAIVIQMDADWSHDPAALPALIAPDRRRTARTSSSARATRRAAASRTGASSGGSSRAAAPCSRASSCGLGPHDLTGGFKAWRATTLAAVPFDGVRAGGYVFQIEMTYRASRLGRARRRGADHLPRPPRRPVQDEPPDHRRGAVRRHQPALGRAARPRPGAAGPVTARAAPAGGRGPDTRRRAASAGVRVVLDVRPAPGPGAGAAHRRSTSSSCSTRSTRTPPRASRSRSCSPSTATTRPTAGRTSRSSAVGCCRRRASSAPGPSPSTRSCSAAHRWAPAGGPSGTAPRGPCTTRPRGALPIASGIPVVAAAPRPRAVGDAGRRTSAGRRAVRAAAAGTHPQGRGRGPRARAARPRTEARRLLHVKQARLRVVPLAARPDVPAGGRGRRRGRGGRASGLGSRYAVYAGRYDARQDLPTLLDALARLAAEPAPARRLRRALAAADLPRRRLARRPCRALAGRDPRRRRRCHRVRPAACRAERLAALVAGARFLRPAGPLRGDRARRARGARRRRAGHRQRRRGAAGDRGRGGDPASSPATRRGSRRRSAPRGLDDELHAQLVDAADGARRATRRTWADVARETRAVWAEVARPAPLL